MGRLRPLKLDLAQALPTPVRRYASPLQRAQYQCQGLMEALLACWKSNEFKDSACKDLISRYDSCIKKEIQVATKQLTDLKAKHAEADRALSRG